MEGPWLVQAKAAQVSSGLYRLPHVTRRYPFLSPTPPPTREMRAKSEMLWDVMSNRTKPKRKKQKEGIFLETLRGGGSIAKAADAAHIARSTAYEWRESDEAFAKAWDDAVEIGTDTLEDEALRRGHDGVDEPIFYKGEQAGYWLNKDGQRVPDTSADAFKFVPHFVRKYSDTLLIVMLNARRPEKFRRERHDNTPPASAAEAAKKIRDLLAAADAIIAAPAKT